MPWNTHDTILQSSLLLVYILHFSYAFLSCPAFNFIIQLNSDDLGEVQEALWEARLKWRNIGLRLNMKSHELDTISKEAGDDIGEKFTKMVEFRLKMTEPCTWKILYEVLKNPTVNMPHVAKELIQKGKIVIPTGKCS